MAKKKLNWFFLLLVVLSAAAIHGSAQATEKSNYVLVWSDEFNAANGSLPDSSKWIMEIGGGGWGTTNLSRTPIELSTPRCKRESW